MSLLLDALRRAEEAKRAKLAAEPADRPGNTAAPAPPREAPGAPSIGGLVVVDDPVRAPGDRSEPPLVASRSPPLDLSLEEIERVAERPSAAPAAPDLAAGMSSAASSLRSTPASFAPASAELLHREQIKAAFAAKNAARPGARAGGRTWLAPVLAVILVTVGGGAWYVWNEINKIGKPPQAAASRPPSIGPAAPAPVAAAANSAPIPADAQRQPVEVPPIPPLLPPAMPAAAPRQAEAPAAPALTEGERLARAIKSAPAPSAPPLALKPAAAVPAALDPDVAAGYHALLAGDARRAAQAYEKAVQSDAYNVDAHLGLATAASRLGNAGLAARHFQEALALDPRNGYALAGLVNLSSDRGGDALEQALRSRLAQNPAAAALHFALGNLHAAHQRWHDAQQAYFDAWQHEPERADYAFNLAVSLDHLRQTPLARQYYAKALALARTGTAQFDLDAAARRLAELAAAAP